MEKAPENGKEGQCVRKRGVGGGEGGKKSADDQEDEFDFLRGFAKRRKGKKRRGRDEVQTRSSCPPK